MEADVLAVGAAGSALSFIAMLWVSRRGRSRVAPPATKEAVPSPSSIPPPLPAEAQQVAKPKLAVNAPKHSDHAALFDWIAERDDWVVLDLETTGYTRNSEIIEIAIVDAYGRTLMDQLVMPKGRVPKTATKIHGINRKMLSGKPKWPDIAEQVATLLRGRPVITYNATFDLRLLRQSSEKWRVAPFEIDGHCAMLAYAAHRAVPHQWRSGEYRWHKLEKACAYEGIEDAQNHRALGDAALTRELIVAIASRKHLAMAA